MQLPISKAPIVIEHIHWYENPINIDQIRASANIFISTSTNEPFGLSILEAMAAGQCVVIPADGAYWDQILKNNINCIKYQTKKADSLQEILSMLNNNLTLVIRIGQQAVKIAEHYRAKKQYKNIIIHIEQLIKKKLDKAL